MPTDKEGCDDGCVVVKKIARQQASGDFAEGRPSISGSKMLTKINSASSVTN